MGSGYLRYHWQGYLKIGDGFVGFVSDYEDPFSTTDAQWWAVPDDDALAAIDDPSTQFDLENLNTGDLTCFAAGTAILTPRGARAVETLKPGNAVVTADGAVLPVLWVGRQTVHRLFTPPERFRPVRVRAGALGDGVPIRDLVVTGDHALLVGGLLVNAGALVNDTSIVREPMAALPEKVTYYHVETSEHALLLAEGAPAESFGANVSRAAFDNGREYAALLGEGARTMPELPHPRAMSRRQLPERIHAALAERARRLRYAAPAAA